MAKYNLQRSLPNIKGSCQWYAAAVVSNPGNYRTVLSRHFHSTPALQPLMPYIDKKAPGKVRKLKLEGRSALVWQAPKYKNEMDRARQYVIYRFAKHEKVDFSSAEHIVAITSDTEYALTSASPHQPYPQVECTYFITALDRLHNESKPVKIKVKD